MLSKRKLLITILASLMVLSIGLTAGCSTPAEPNPDEKGTIEFTYCQWACAEAETHIAEAVLEDMGYDVEKSVVEAGIMWTSVANGDSDVFTTAWLPYTHESYWAKYQNDVEDLGSIFEEAVLAIVVPSYVTIDSLAEMKDYEEEFDGRIVGIDPGAGIMQHTAEDTMPAYGLEDWTLVESSGAAMTAELGSAIDKGEWIAVTGWAPHWKFFKWDLKMLEDPELTLGEQEEIRVIARKGFSEDFPEAAQMLRNFHITAEQLGEVMYMINVEDIDPEEAARTWVDANQDVVSQWIP
jgi:glycine betaine/proline transport system substrate-binding protein